MAADGEQYPFLFAGIHLQPQSSFRLFIEMSPKFALRRKIYELLEQHLPALTEMETSWELLPWDTDSWQLFVNVVPLENLLSTDDQLSWLTGYTQHELTALRESGLVDDIRHIVQA